MPSCIYSGQCHCGAVRFRCRAPLHLVCWGCNCSVCIMKKNTHFVVPQGDFVLLSCPPESERLNADAAWKDAEKAKSGPYPSHWLLPPRAQTRDLRELPGGYGKGSGTLAKWIQSNMDADECNPSSSVAVKEQDHPSISTYTYNTHVAKHTFCTNCGVQSFYHPRSNPDGVGVTMSCLVPSVPLAPADEACEFSTSELRGFDGQNWEDYIDKSGIKEFSKSGGDTLEETEEASKHV